MSSTTLMHPEDVADQLALLARAHWWLAEARSLEEVLQFRDQVEAIRHYRQVSGQAVEACNEAAEMKLREQAGRTARADAEAAGHAPPW